MCSVVVRLHLPVEYFSGPSLVCNKGPDHPETRVARSGKLSKPDLFGKPVWTSKPGDSGRPVLAGRSGIRAPVVDRDE